MFSAFAPFSILAPGAGKRAMSAIWAALERVERFPELGRLTKDPDVRQIIVPFGTSGYIVRYCVLPGD